MGKNSSRNFALFVQLKKKKTEVTVLLSCCSVPSTVPVIVVEPEEVQGFCYCCLVAKLCPALLQPPRL